MTTSRERRAMGLAEAKGETYDPARLGRTGRTGRRNREHRIIAAVGCPHCGVRLGMPCTVISDGDTVLQETGRVWVHGDRRTAWQMARDGELR